MSRRLLILGGMAAGLVWAVALVAVARGAPFIPAPVALPTAFILPGLVLIAMIGRLAARRFFDDTLIDGQPYAPGTSAARDQAILTNSIEQLVLALVIWPFVANSLGGAVVLALGVSFVVARLLFWVGYHISPPLRALGFAGTFYPTVVAAFWSGAAWMGWV